MQLLQGYNFAEYAMDNGWERLIGATEDMTSGEHSTFIKRRGCTDPVNVIKMAVQMYLGKGREAPATFGFSSSVITEQLVINGRLETTTP